MASLGGDVLLYWRGIYNLSLSRYAVMSGCSLMCVETLYTP